MADCGGRMHISVVLLTTALVISILVVLVNIQLFCFTVCCLFLFIFWLFILVVVLINYYIPLAAMDILSQLVPIHVLNSRYNSSLPFF
jgi:hypothetical protein